MAKTTGEKLPKTDAGKQAWLQNRRPPAEREWTSFGHGLVVALSPSGDKTFQARLRRIGDANARRITLGHFPECSLAEARQRLAAARATVKEGKDPGRRRKREGVEEILTFGALADQWLADRRSIVRPKKGPYRPKTLAVEAQAVARLKRALGSLLLADVAPDLIGEAVKKRRPGCARRGGPAVPPISCSRFANEYFATAARLACSTGNPRPAI
ncbi:MAG TPA: integrase arm-type DNA-binding domain-containing protein [Methylocystis sp.]|jgi:hypothetical protein